MQVNKIAEVIIANAVISLEMLGGLLRLIQDAFAASIASQENIQWDIHILSAQGEDLTLSSFELDDKISQWIRERVITRVHATISAACNGIRREVHFDFEIGAAASIKIRGDSAFVDLTDRRITEWKNDLPQSRFPFFTLATLFVALISGAFVFVVLAITREYSYMLLGIAVPTLTWIALPIAMCSLIAGIGTWEYSHKIWPCVSLDLGKPTKEKKRRGIIIMAVKWFAGLLALAASAATIFNFLYQ